MSTALQIEPSAFLQIIEYRTNEPEAVAGLIDQWSQAIGARRTARWYITAADRDRPDTYLQLVEFPSHAAAMANSDHPATAQFAAELARLSTQQVTFRNLDIAAVTAFEAGSGLSSGQPPR